MTNTNDLAALVRAAAVLDNDPSADQIAGVRQLADVFARMAGIGGPDSAVDMWCWGLAWSTREWCDELVRGGDDGDEPPSWAANVSIKTRDGWSDDWNDINPRARKRDFWMKDRISAERCLFGEVRSKSLQAAAETHAETRTDDDASTDTIESLIPPEAPPAVIIV